MASGFGIDVHWEAPDEVRVENTIGLQSAAGTPSSGPIMIDLYENPSK